MTDCPHARFPRLFAESREALRRYIRRLVRSDETAEEIVQEAFLRTYEHGNAVEVPRAFLFSTARNLATDRQRHERVAAKDSIADFDDSRVEGVGGPLEDALIADEASRRLKKAVERLPPQCQAVLTLKVFQGLFLSGDRRNLGALREDRREAHRAYEEIAGTWQQLHDTGKVVSSVALGQAFGAIAERAIRRSKRASRVRIGLSVAASLVLAALVGVWRVNTLTPRPEFQTTIGEHARRFNCRMARRSNSTAIVGRASTAPSRRASSGSNGVKP